MTTEEIWKDFGVQLTSFVRTKVPSNDIAEDIVQEVFLKIHSNRESLRDQEKLTSWLYQVTRNTIADYYRKELKTSSLRLEPLEDETDLNQEYVPCLKPFVDQLPEMYREALMLTLYGKISQKEYAIRKKLSYSAAKSRVQRARKMLRQIFLDCCDLRYDSYGNIYENASSSCSCP